ncbi:hypothetical protein T4D_1046 [Trichinella pseudospiralis]|uniref:Uncharacterized protein n=1 Tax=Trichinella pseudospiralis TaxID=6337 RepID=A0A0V1G1E5_TRIPS|nr:hypothetical protein T4D_1046 [Trichinella pseudospiralis]
MEITHYTLFDLFPKYITHEHIAPYYLSTLYQLKANPHRLSAFYSSQIILQDAAILAILQQRQRRTIALCKLVRNSTHKSTNSPIILPSLPFCAYFARFLKTLTILR